jgi:isocitrate dehydrogenase kinase/phosphatase
MEIIILTAPTSIMIIFMLLIHETDETQPVTLFATGSAQSCPLVLPIHGNNSKEEFFGTVKIKIKNQKIPHSFGHGFFSMSITLNCAFTKKNYRELK